MSMEEAKEFLVKKEGRWCHPEEKFTKGTNDFKRLCSGLRRFNRKMKKYGFNILHTKKSKGNLFYMLDKGSAEKIKAL